MPRLWTETIDEHRRAVRDATLVATAALVAEYGRGAATMSRIADETGIGRATFFFKQKTAYEILIAWHERQISHHLAMLEEIRDTTDPTLQVEAVLTAYARIRRAHHGTELAAELHSGAHVAHARRRLLGFVAAMIADSATTAGIRTDVSPKELANFCVHALDGAAHVRTQRAADRLVSLVLGAIRDVT